MSRGESGRTPKDPPPADSASRANMVSVAAMAGVLALAALAVREAALAPAATQSTEAPTGSGPEKRSERPHARRAFRPKVRAITRETVRAKGLSEHEAMYYEKLPENEVQCALCATHCLLSDGQRGQCRVRVNYDGTLYTLVYGKPLSRAIDPIEKKPLFHFLPGTKILSIATAGCCLRCRFCQNWQISQAHPEDARHFDWPPEAVVAAAVEFRCPSIAFTYTEPSIYYEYMLDTARLARAKGIKTVWVTCGYLNEAPLVELCKYLDGANVDLKGFSEEYYRDYCGGRLQPVLDTLKVLRREKVFFEITNLIVPGGNDDPKMIERMCRWIREELGADTPLHFSRYHPAYKMARPGPTPTKTLLMARAIARDAGLKHVYVGNVTTPDGAKTACSKCGQDLIVRWRYILQKNAVR
ncbi:MAG: AmmeMemoRadiSam system radical SAM enzyme, partial [Planctomycetota bacterium]